MGHEVAQLPPLWEVGLRLILLAVVMLGGCGALDQFADAKEIAAADLKDPASAQFRDMRRCNLGIITGEMNARNSFGGYVGFERFWIDEGKRFTLMESTPEEFDRYSKACTGATV